MTNKTTNERNEPIKDLKFKVWHKKLKQIFEVHSLYYSASALICVDLVQNAYVEHEYVDIDDVVMLQYTNMKDEHNKELYEYDIVEVGEHYDGDTFIKKRMYVVRQTEGCFNLYAFDDYDKHIDKQFYLSELHTHVINNRVTRILNLDKYLDNEKKVESLAAITKVDD